MSAVHYFKHLALLLLFAFIALGATHPAQALPATLSSYGTGSAQTGSASASVTINLLGLNFDTSTADNQIILTDSHGVATNFGAPVIATAAGTALSQTAALPAIADNYKLTVKTAGATAAGMLTFAVMPTVTASAPTTGAAGATSFSLTLTGTGFDTTTLPNNVINFNGTALAMQTINSANATTLTATVTLPAPAGTDTITVTTNGQTSLDSATFTVTPTVTAANPTTGAAGASSFSLTLTGTGFDTTTLTNNVIKFNGTALATQTINSANATTLVATVTLPAAVNATNAVTVTTNGQTTPASVPFATTAATLTSISPTTGAAGASVTLTVTGTGFSAAADNQVIFTDSHSNAANFGSPVVATGGGTTLSVTGNVPNPADTYTVTVKVGAANPIGSKTFAATPTITAINPFSGPAGATGVTLTLTGTGFDTTTLPNNVIKFNGTALATQTINNTTTATSLSATVTLPAGVSAINPVRVTTNGQTTPVSVNFRTTAAALTSISPTTGTAGASVMLTVTGTGFSAAADNQIILTPNSGGAPANFGSPIVATGGGTTLTVTGNVPNLADSYTVTVKVGAASPIGSSPATTFAATPTLASINPTTGPAGGTSFPLTLTGTGFDTNPANNVIKFNGATLAQTINAATATTLTASVTLPSTPSSSNAVTVTTNGQTTPVSISFATTNISLSSISPTTGAAGAANFTLTLHGTGFDTAADNQIIFTDSKGVTTNFGPATASPDGTTLTVIGTVPNPADSYTVTVGVGTGPTSNAKTFVATPTVTASNPNTGPAGATGFLLSLTGTGFDTIASNNVISFNGTALTTQIINSTSATTLNATVTLPSTINPSNAVTVTTRSQTTPVSVPFATTAATITSISPATGTAGASVTLTVTGTGFSGSADNQIILTDSHGNATNFGSPVAATGSGTTLSVTATVPNPADIDTVTVKVGAAPPIGSSPATTFAATPTLSAINPTSGSPSASISVTLSGTGFDASAADNQVNFTDSNNIVTSFGQAAIAAGNSSLSVTGTLPTISGKYKATVTTRGQIGTPVPFTVNSAPSITSISPTRGVSGATLALTLTGTGFTTGTVNTVVFSQGATQTTFGSANATSATSLTVTGTLPTASGAYSITVANANGTSSAVNFAVTPSITAVSPTSGPAGATGFSLTLNGAGFDPGTLSNNVVLFNGAPLATQTITTVSADGKSLAATVSLPTVAAVYTVGVTTGGVTSPATAQFTINPAPSITSINPTTGTQGATLSLTFTGTGFTTGTVNTVVFSQGAPVTTFGSAGATSATSLTVTGTLPGAAGTYTVTVTNANGTSNNISFTVGSSGLTLSAVTGSPAAAVTGTPEVLTLLGTGFDSGTATNNKVYFTQSFAQNKAGIAQPFGTATSVNSNGTQLTVGVPNNMLPSPAGTYQVTVQIPDPAHPNSVLTSTPQFFAVNNPAAGIVSMNGTVTGGSSPVSAVTINTTLTSLVITGRGFVSSYVDSPKGNTVAGSTVTFTQNNAALLTPGLTYSVSADDKTLTVTGLPPGFTSAAGAITVIVSNPGPGGGPSNAGTFTVYYPVPTITALFPLSGAAGSPISLTITGTNFFSGVTTVTVAAADGTIIANATASSSSSTITIPLTLPTTPQTITITVTNPIINGYPAGNNSATAAFTVTAAAISLIPSSGYVGDPAIKALTITTPGSFPAGTTVTLTEGNGTVIVLVGNTATPATPKASNTISAPVAPANINLAGNDLITVSEPNGSSTPDRSTAPFTALPLGPLQTASAPPKTGLAMEYFTAAATPVPNSADGLLLFSVPYDYTDKTQDGFVAMLPVAPGQPGRSALAKITPSTLWTSFVPDSNLAVWDSTTSTYDITNMAPYSPAMTSTLANALALGQGYWGRFPDTSATATTIVGLVKRGKPAIAIPVTTATAPTPIDAQGRFTISLHPGWNMIGDPWAETDGQTARGVFLQNMQVTGKASDNQSFTGTLTDADANGLVSAVFYEYDSGKNQYVAVNGFISGSKIMPYSGYWAHANRDCQLLVPQP